MILIDNLIINAECVDTDFIILIHHVQGEKAQ